MTGFILAGHAKAEIVHCQQGLSFWGGVDASSGVIIDGHHPQRGQSLAGKIVLMPTSRGSCTGSAVLLGLILKGAAPKALVFREPEDILTLGALVGQIVFDHQTVVLRLGAQDYDWLAAQPSAQITPEAIICAAGRIALPAMPQPEPVALALSPYDRACLAGEKGEAAALAMRVITVMAGLQGARELLDIGRVHIDGCIYASPACLTFAQKMADLGAKTCVPTTMNAISVDYANWRAQGVDEAFGTAASALADAYTRMGASPSFTCAPYLLADRPQKDEPIAWAESNAVIYANSVLGARTIKHADFMDLCIALTGRAPRAGVYLDQARRPARVITVEAPDRVDDAFWPMLGWLAGEAAPDRIPLICGVAHLAPSEDDLKALCAAFGTTSAAPMLHVEGITPNDATPLPEASTSRIGPSDFDRLWTQFNAAPAEIDLIALGSPHFSVREAEQFAGLLAGRKTTPATAVIITLGRGSLGELEANGLRRRLEDAGVRLVPDLCWCSISEPVFPPSARVLMTNSGKYAHYAPGLAGRAVRFGSLAQCAEAACSGRAPSQAPDWITLS